MISLCTTVRLEVSDYSQLSDYNFANKVDPATEIYAHYIRGNQ